MTPARWLHVTLICAYVVLAVLYGVDKDWPRVLYWVGAAILGTGVLLA